MPTPLRDTLSLERLEMNLFRGRSPEEQGERRIFGGQVIAQALAAAYATVEARVCHSLHCYFMRPGDTSIPIIFEVDRSRDGRSFTTRRVVAIQNGRQIFNLAASFQVEERGAEEGDPGKYHFRQWAVDWRFTDPRRGGKLPTRHSAWFRISEPLGDDPRTHQAALAYCSDIGLLSSASRPHDMHWTSERLQAASLDHAMWFHRPTDANQWHLYEMDSPSASGARGFNIGSIYRHDGTLVATTAQEGLLRWHDEAPPNA